MSKDTLDVVGIGNAIVDILSESNDAFLAENRIHKGTMTLIDAPAAEALYVKMGSALQSSGGSAANTIAGLASMGARTGYIGKVAHDALGTSFSHDIRSLGTVYTTAPLVGGAPTARCLILITPDAQRTMCTYLGASVTLAPEDVDAEMIKNAKVTYLEGYLFDRDQAKQAFRRAARLAHAAKHKVALTLSDPFCVERHRPEFLDLIKNHVDILFANEAEILSLYQVSDFSDAADRIAADCPLAVLTRSAKGSIIISKGETVTVAAEPVARVVDTTGAGDLYAAGFLYGYTQGRDLAACGRIASIAAAEIIAQVGARPQRNLAALLREKQAA